MNYREDLELNLQKVTLAIQEVAEGIYESDQAKQRMLATLYDFKKNIITKSIELNIDLGAI